MNTLVCGTHLGLNGMISHHRQNWKLSPWQESFLLILSLLLACLVLLLAIEITLTYDGIYVKDENPLTFYFTYIPIPVV